LAVAATGVLASLLLAKAAGSAPSPSQQLHMTVSIAVPVRSLTISVKPPTGKQSCTAGQQAAAVAVSLSRTSDCQLPVGTIVIQNGAVSSHIQVSGSDAVPTDAGKHWTLCGVNDSACAGKRGRPGANQFQIATVGGSKRPTVGTILSYATQCDTAFDLGTATQGCVAKPRQTAGEGISALVASSSTDTSATFITTTTWTAGEGISALVASSSTDTSATFITTTTWTASA
jgi:hypothetical protein